MLQMSSKLLNFDINKQLKLGSVMFLGDVDPPVTLCPIIGYSYNINTHFFTKMFTPPIKSELDYIDL